MNSGGHNVSYEEGEAVDMATGLQAEHGMSMVGCRSRETSLALRTAHVL